MPAPVVSRLNTIVYGGVTIGGTSDYQLIGPLRVETDYPAFTVRATVMCQDDTRTTFVTECNALEAAFRTPNSDLSVTLNGTAYKTLTAAGNTGMLGRADCKLRGHPADTNNSRIYDVSVSVMLPADETGKAGRRSAKVTVFADASGIQSLSIDATYTAIGGNDALAQAKSAGAFPAYYAAQETAVDSSAVWDEPLLSYTYDSDDKVVTATYRSTEILTDQTSAGKNSTALRGVVTRVSTRRNQPGSDPGSGARPLLEVTVEYFVNVRRDVSTDLKGLWDDTIFPYLRTTALAQSGATNLTVVDATPIFDTDNNTIAAVLRFVGADGNTVTSSRTTIATLDRKPELLIPVLNGDPHARDIHFRPGLRLAIITGSGIEIGITGASMAVFNATVKQFQRDGYRLQQEEDLGDASIELPGHSVSTPLILRSITRRATLEFANIVSGRVGSGHVGSGGGGGGTRTRRARRRP